MNKKSFFLSFFWYASAHLFTGIGAAGVTLFVLDRVFKTNVPGSYIWRFEESMDVMQTFDGFQGFVITYELLKYKYVYFTCLFIGVLLFAIYSAVKLYVKKANKRGV